MNWISLTGKIKRISQKDRGFGFEMTKDNRFMKRLLLKEYGILVKNQNGTRCKDL
jgi:hypothetical protein